MVMLIAVPQRYGKGDRYSQIERGYRQDGLQE